MVSLICLEIDGFLELNKKIKIWSESGKYYATFSKTDIEQENKEIESAIYDKFAERIDELKLNSWNDCYVPEEGIAVCDGETWSLNYVIGDEKRTITGDNAYPDCWDKFMEALEIIFPVEFFD